MDLQNVGIGLKKIHLWGGGEQCGKTSPEDQKILFSGQLFPSDAAVNFIFFKKKPAYRAAF